MGDPDESSPPATEPASGRQGRAGRTALRTDAAVETQRIAATLGREARSSRRRRGRTQASMARDVGTSRSRYAELERGEGAMAPLDLWVRLGLTLGRPLSVAFSRDIAPDLPADAGHLSAQEWLLDRAEAAGRTANLEIRTSADPGAGVADVVIRDDPMRTLAFIEVWNRIGDLGAAIRSGDRKLLETPALADAAGAPGQPYRVVVAWLFVDTAANRRLVARYPSIVRTRFPGPSMALVRALRGRASFPSEPTIAWFDARARDVRPMRRPRPTSRTAG